MIINTDNILSVSEINHNFSKAMHKVDQVGQVIIFKNNKPKYLFTDVENNPLFDLTDDEKIDVVSKRVFERYKNAFLELAK